MNSKGSKYMIYTLKQFINENYKISSVLKLKNDTPILLLDSTEEASFRAFSEGLGYKLEDMIDIGINRKTHERCCWCHETAFDLQNDIHYLGKDTNYKYCSRYCYEEGELWKL